MAGLNVDRACRSAAIVNASSTCIHSLEHPVLILSYSAFSRLQKPQKLLWQLYESGIQWSAPQGCRDYSLDRIRSRSKFLGPLTTTLLVVHQGMCRKLDNPSDQVNAEV